MTCFYLQTSIGAWFLPMVVLTTLCALQFPLASRRGMLTPTQMQAQSIMQGIPLTGHGSTWTCLFALNPLLSIFVAEYWQQWSGHDLLVAFGSGYTCSFVAHLMVFVRGKYPEAHVRNGKLEPAGWAHLVYFGLAVSLLVLIYVYTSGIPSTVLWTLTAYMVGHIWLGNHFVNRINKPAWFPHEYSFWALDAWIPVLFVLFLLAGSAYWNLTRRDIMWSGRAEMPYTTVAKVPQAQWDY
jgi:hypothetical protein